MQDISVIGAGAWGTALAIAMHRAGRKVRIWAYEKEVVEAINTRHENSIFLPGIALPPEISASSDLKEILQTDAVLLVSPAQFLRASCKASAPYWQEGLPAVICAKGIEQGSLAMMSEVVKETLPQAPQAVLSGPTFAAEVAKGLPSAITLAADNPKIGEKLIQAIGSTSFRPYLSHDVVGAEIGGAVKNVLAIASGIIEGKGLGANAKAAMITRGLAELIRLAKAKGGKGETLMGLSGLGDLILTANSMQSRNMSLGVALGQGKSLEEILGQRRSVAEGVFSAQAVVGLANRHGIEMPICMAVDNILNKGADIDKVVQDLLSRPFKTEH